MKLINKLLALVLASACIFGLTACEKKSDEEKLDTAKTGWGFKCKIVEVEKDDESSESAEKKYYAVVSGIVLSDSIKYAVDTDGADKTQIPEDLKNLVIGKDGKINVVKFDGEKASYKDNKMVYETKEVEYIEIMNAAFANQKAIESVVLGDKVTKVGEGAFAGCVNIEKMELPFVGTEVDAKNKNKLFASVFGTSEVAGATSVEASYNTSGKATFFIPNSLKEVVVNYSGNAVLPEYAFNKITSLKNVTLNGITAIPNNAFDGCTGLTTVTLDNKVTSIGAHAFNGCSSLVKVNPTYKDDKTTLIQPVNFPESLTTIFQNAFAGCAKLGSGKGTKVTFGGNIATIYDRAFTNCTNLVNVKFDNAATSIKDFAFYGCEKLEKPEGFDALTNVGTDAFTKCKFTKADKVED